MIRAGIWVGRALGTSVLLVLTAVGEAAAQCVMCGQAAASAGEPEQVAATFNTAILLMLIPVALLLAAAGLLLWRFRHDHGGGYRGAIEAPQELLRRTDGPGAVLPLRHSRPR